MNKSLALVLGLGLTACGLQKSPNQTWNHPAPQSAEDVGVLYQGDPDQLQSLLDREGGSARILDGKGHLYEVFDIEADLIRREIPTAAVERNVYLDNLIPTSRRRFNGVISNISLLQAETPAIEEALESCVRDEESPEVKLSVGGDVHEELTKGLLELGKTLTLSSQGTAAHPNHPGDLATMWVVNSPALATSPQQVSTGEELNFTPEALGQHDIVLVVKDARGVCAGSGVSFVVTENPEYQKPTSSRSIPASELERFTYLAEVEAAAAQKISRGKGITIAVIDTGVNYNHPDLAANILINEKEIPDNSIDDDGNGLVDDVLGWDFSNGDNKPFDDQSHGTHVAGLSAAAGYGLAPEAKILAIKALNGFGGGDVGSVAAAIRYAADRGAQVINTSLGSSDVSFKTLQSAIDYAESKGVLVVTASGNGDPLFGRGLNLERTPMWPASFTNKNIITVASVAGDKLTSYSNFGRVSVDVAAPGGSDEGLIVSSAYANPQGELLMEMAGTSMASPIVAGIAALVLSKDPKLTPENVRDVLVKSGRASGRLEGRIVSGRVISALDAVNGGAAAQPSEQPTEPAPARRGLARFGFSRR